MEDFSTTWTVEVFGSKGWEVAHTDSDEDSAIAWMRTWLSEYPVRLTSPLTNIPRQT